MAKIYFQVQVMPDTILPTRTVPLRYVAFVLFQRIVKGNEYAGMLLRAPSRGVGYHPKFYVLYYQVVKRQKVDSDEVQVPSPGVPS